MLGTLSMPCWQTMLLGRHWTLTLALRRVPGTQKAREDKFAGDTQHSTPSVSSGLCFTQHGGALYWS